MNWLLQCATGTLHLDGFESPSLQNKNTTQGVVFLFWQRMITCRYWRIDSTVITHAVPLFILAFYYYFKVFPFINELLDFL